MKSSIFRDITPFSLLKINGCFGGKCRFNLQGRRESQARNQAEITALFFLGFLLASFIDPEDGDRTFLRRAG
jgi:hypothetical protein